ncbi:glutamate/gamma-aminobutyrate antiporter (extreme acid sensitivity protein) [Escherichia coli]|uniref:Glutamate/gamma-aminobutyrate antiporter (Extreme acid sensitivity protein) n=1 Tax=Escherichia coli TaxID=562 RepID=A0A376VKM2_ECOLX|nr:glutamate/gamma-aminobutyrate antiporter (extreme acid sensitivity protein) [Escherichia coli]
MVYSRGTLCCGNGHRRTAGKKVVSSPGYQILWGPRWGFAAISFGYLQIAIGFIPMLYFVLGALSYILKWPALNEDPITKTIAALIILWALALTQFGGTKIHGANC